MTVAEVVEAERVRRLIRSDGHKFSVNEVAQMTGEELELNWTAVRAQIPHFGAERNAGLTNPKSVS